MTKKRRKAVSWVSASGLLLGIGVGAFMLLGAAEEGNEVLRVDAAAWISVFAARSDDHIDTVYLFLAVTSPTRGGIDQLRRGNIRVVDAYYADPGGVEENPLDGWALDVVGFANMGGGFYRINVAPFAKWLPVQYAVLIEVECPWGRGVAVCELPVGAAGSYHD